MHAWGLIPIHGAALMIAGNRTSGVKFPGTGLIRRAVEPLAFLAEELTA
jgi:hypothetical protein